MSDSELMSKLIKENVDKLSVFIPFIFPATAWHFASKMPIDAVEPNSDEWSCMFSFLYDVMMGKKLCLSADRSGCSGAACYLGFKAPGPTAGSFLAEKERFKKTISFGEKFYEDIKALPAMDNYAILTRVEDLQGTDMPEVITLWVNGFGLSGLVTLANYDRETNDNVIVPFASGCQSIWTIPYKEKLTAQPQAVIGLVDPAVRPYLPPEVISFSVPTERFLEMAQNIEESFLMQKPWRQLLEP